MRVRRKFLQLTKRTFPYGTENELIFFLPNGYKTDEHGNYFIQIGESNTMFTCHLDTASTNTKIINHRFVGNFIKTDGTTILGADDKAGMTVVLYMIENKVPGLYYFFIGEEVGCIGSRELSVNFSEQYPHINKVVSFDRRGTESIITHQLMGRCCSDEFAVELSLRLNSVGQGLKMIPDDTGIMTDSAQFMDIVPECTNISVGYNYEHTIKEIQDIDFLSKLCRSCVLIDWESLPIVRNPDEEEVYMDGEYDMYNENGELIEEDDFFEEEVNYSNFAYINGVKTFISNEWIEQEKLLICEMLERQGHYPSRVFWNGYSCSIIEDDSHCFIGTRNELMDFIPSLVRIPNIHKK
jgi:hypothetical protein